MRKAILLYNPFSGRRRNRRLADVKVALDTLRAAGIDASAAPTAAGGRTSDQVKQAIAQDFDTIFACGGDGTVHDILQGLVGTEAALGIIPLGTANSLACDLGLPTTAAAAATASMTAQPRKVAVGKIEYLDFSGNTASRYFAFIVGVGVDAEMFYKLNPSMKRSLGMAAYCAKATWLWLTHGLEPLAVEITRTAARAKSMFRNCWRCASATSAESCANWRLARLLTATISAQSSSIPAAAGPICVTFYGDCSARTGMFLGSSW